MECWDIIAKARIKAIKSFFKSGNLLKKFNYSYIVLIPKSNKAYEFKDYRLISLCNLIYKIISKILANRMRPILRKITSPT